MQSANSTGRTKGRDRIDGRWSRKWEWPARETALAKEKEARRRRGGRRGRVQQWGNRDGAREWGSSSSGGALSFSPSLLVNPRWVNNCITLELHCVSGMSLGFPRAGCTSSPRRATYLPTKLDTHSYPRRARVYSCYSAVACPPRSRFSRIFRAHAHTPARMRRGAQWATLNWISRSRGLGRERLCAVSFSDSVRVFRELFVLLSSMVALGNRVAICKSRGARADFGGPAANERQSCESPGLPGFLFSVVFVRVHARARGACARGAVCRWDFSLWQSVDW